MPLIYGLLLKQCSLSPTHYKFTFTYITACILHTNLRKRERGNRTFFVPRNGSGLLEGEGREQKHLGNYQRGLFLPFNNCTQMSSAPKKDTNLNVKVSIINQLGGGSRCWGGGGHPSSLAYCYGKQKHRAWLGRFSGCHLAK